MTMTMRELEVFECPLDGVHLIEASAGTGKTWNICGLYLRLLLEGQHSVEEILVVTFTKAATAELRDRIRSRLAQLRRVLADDRDMQGDPFIKGLMTSVIGSGRVSRLEAAQRIRLALESFDTASIFTIHGFCQRALAETPFAASQPFRQELMPDDIALRHEVACDFWRHRVMHDELDEGFAAHLLAAKVGPEWLAAQLGRRLKKPLARLLWPSFPATRGPSISELEEAFRAAKGCWGEEAAVISETILGALDQLHGATYKATAVQAGAEAWRRYLQSGDPLVDLDPKLGLFRSATLAARTKKGCITPDHVFFQRAETLLARREEMATSFTLLRLQLLRDWLGHGPDELRRRKRERRLLSFDDMLARLHGALTDHDLPWLAAALRQRYPCALIDEFQDTDPLQFAIFSRIYGSGGHGPLFLVGDPKQAIYSFRSADINTYLAARDKADARHTLSANQRSTPGLIKALNHLFAANPAAFILPGLRYQAIEVGAKPRPPFTDRSATGRDLQLWMLPAETEALLRKAEARRLAIQATAAEIARLLTEAVNGRISIGMNPLRAADIAVLVRSHAQGSAIKQALGMLGVGCVDLDQTSIFNSAQAEEVERVLLAVADPTRTTTLKGALSTELIGLESKAIACLASDEQVALWIQKFQDYRGLWLAHGFGFMWRCLLREAQSAARLLVMADGERRLTNLLQIGEMLQQAAATQPGIEDLLRWLAQHRTQTDPAEETAQLRLESDENLVQILTVHKAKGLEFPIVFCPFLFDGRVGGPGGGSLEGVEYHLGEEGVIDFSVDEGEVEVARAGAKVEEAAEQVRLIYVALTRAIYRCYLVTGCYGSAGRGRPSARESARSVLNWLAAGAGSDFVDWQGGEATPAGIACAWQDLALAGAGSIGLAPLPVAVGIPLPPVLQEASSFAVRQATRPLYESWRLGSFSALQRLSEQEGARPEYDAWQTETSRPRWESPLALGVDDFLYFPQGPAAGECLHRALELADFSDPATWEGAIGKSLRQRPPTGGAELPGDRLSAMLRAAFNDVLRTPLREGLRLQILSRKECLTELEFCFPVVKVAASELNRLLAAHGYEQPRLTFPTLQGFMKGFIDLIFCHQGRFYLLDWKSNHLGYSPADYSPEALGRAMRQHGYHLQYLIYSVALHRYLRLRLADYDFNRHVGGCLYLFVRGVRPGWLNSDGSPCGVFFHRPQLALIEALDRLFAPVSEESP